MGIDTMFVKYYRLWRDYLEWRMYMRKWRVNSEAFWRYCIGKNTLNILVVGNEDPFMILEQNNDMTKVMFKKSEKCLQETLHKDMLIKRLMYCNILISRYIRISCHFIYLLSLFAFQPLALNLIIWFNLIDRMMVMMWTRIW